MVFSILKFLHEHKQEVVVGRQPWPTEHSIRENLFRREAPADPFAASNESNGLETGSEVRSDLFRKELEACVAEGWINKDLDKDSGRFRYSITDAGEKIYEEHGKFILDLMRRLLLTRRGSKRPP